MTGDPWANGDTEEGPIPAPPYRRRDPVVRADDAEVQGIVLDVLFGGSMLTVKWLGGDVVTCRAEEVQPAPTTRDEAHHG